MFIDQQTSENGKKMKNSSQFSFPLNAPTLCSLIHFRKKDLFEFRVEKIFSNWKIRQEDQKIKTGWNWTGKLGEKLDEDLQGRMETNKKKKYQINKNSIFTFIN